MSADGLSHFVEKSGIVACTTPWGRWWQTVHEVQIEVDLPKGTKGKQVSVDVKPSFISVCVSGKEIFSGKLFNIVHSDETTWTIEDAQTLSIILGKATPYHKEEIWESLLENGQFAPDPITIHEMRKKWDLEKFQIENPGFDFSRASLSKCYDKPPGWSKKKLEDSTQS